MTTTAADPLPYVCRVCGRGFATQRGLSRHGPGTRLCAAAPRPAYPARCLYRYTYALQSALENLRDATAYAPGSVRDDARYVLGADGRPTPATVALADVWARGYLEDGTSTYCPAHPASTSVDH